jgi:hypothetical protein
MATNSAEQYALIGIERAFDLDGLGAAGLSGARKGTRPRRS